MRADLSRRNLRLAVAGYLIARFRPWHRLRLAGVAQRRAGPAGAAFYAECGVCEPAATDGLVSAVFRRDRSGRTLHRTAYARRADVVADSNDFDILPGARTVRNISRRG